jgi:hypothetical protein
MKFNLRAGVPVLAASALATGALAGPAMASSKSSLTSVTHHVRAANAALVSLEHNVKHHHKLAAGALKHLKVEIKAETAAVKALRHHATVADTASAAGAAAFQSDLSLRTLTSLLPNAGSLETQIAQALQTALSGRTLDLGILSGLTGSLTGSSATDAGNLLTTLLGGTPGEIGSIGGLINGGQLPTSITGMLGQFVSMAEGALDIGLGQLQDIVPMLPASVQPQVEALISQLSSMFSELQKTLEGIASTLTGPTGSGGTSSSTGTGTTFGLGGVFGQGLSLLQNLLGNIFGMLTGGSGTGTGTGSGGTTGTGISGLPGLTGLPGLGSGLPMLNGIPSFIQSLLGQFGMSMPFGLSADVR